MNSTSPLLCVKQLHTRVAEKSILQGINLEVHPGEIHAIMGPNGSGKSSFAYTIAAHPEHKITAGQVLLNNIDINSLTPDKCALHGLFVAMQHPITIPGVSTLQFLHTILNTKNKYLGLPAIDQIDLRKKIQPHLEQLKISPLMLDRFLNEGCSGGEKKINELLQLLVLEPSLAILDELDSGLDIDTLRLATKTINALFHKNMALILITHYQRILNYIHPTHVHVLAQGKIVLSGDHLLAHELEKHGYHNIMQTHVTS